MSHFTPPLPHPPSIPVGPRLHSSWCPAGPNGSHEDQNRKWLCNPCYLRGPQRRARHSRGPQQRGQIQRGPKIGRKCYITPAVSGVPNKGDKIKRAQKRAEMLHRPCIHGGPQQRGTKSKRAQRRLQMLHDPCILGAPQQTRQNESGPNSGRMCCITPSFSGIPNKRDNIEAGRKEGGNATSPLHSRGSPTIGTKSKRAQKRAEMLHHPCLLGDPQQPRQSQSGIKRGRKCYVTPAFSGIPNKGDKINGGPKEGPNATSTLHSRGSPTNKTKSKQA